MGDNEPLLDLGSAGQRISISASGAYEAGQIAGGHTRAQIKVEAYPFSGVIETVFSEEDLVEYSSGVETFRTSGKATLGGNRGPQVRLEHHGDVIEVEVTVSADDPWPTIKYLIFPL